MVRLSLIALLLVTIAAPGSLASPNAAPEPATPKPSFDLQTIADDVYAAIRT
jgi:hypothetical protein